MLIRTLVVCASLSSTWALAQTPDAGTAPAAPSSADAVAKLDELFTKRDDAVALKEADKVISDTLKAIPNDYEVLWRAARQRWWVADGAAEEKLKRQLGKEGWIYAERALNAGAAA